MSRVVFLTAILTHYRLGFHARTRKRLSQRGISYQLVYGLPDAAEAAKGDTAALPWATPIRNRRLGPLLWQPALRHITGADLVILGQENKLLLNYLLQLSPKRFRPRIALFGHGRNFQSRAPQGIAEQWKRFWAIRADWWFAYTEETRRHIASLGFPEERITVFNNSVDTAALALEAERVTPERLAVRRAELGLAGRHVGVYVGGLYSDKRLGFLIEAADHVRERVADFELLIVGGGPSEPELKALAAGRPWVKMTGPRFGADKAELMALGHLFLMPGASGLAILDAGVMGLPMVATVFPWHGPEIAYLEDDVNGFMVTEWQDPGAYARAVTDLLGSPARRAAMAEAARKIASTHTIENMAERFVEGVNAALHPGL